MIGLPSSTVASKKISSLKFQLTLILLCRLVCVGSSLFLKSLYGVGYYLTLVKDSKEKTTDHNFEGIVNVSAARKSSAAPACSLNSVEDTDDEGISDLSTHETIINPSEGNEK